MAVNDLFRASLIFNASGAAGDVVNVVDFVQDELVVSKTQPQYCAELASEIASVVEDELMPNLTNDWELDRVEVHGITDPTAQAVQASGTSGDGVGDNMNLRSGVVISKLTGLRGRSYRGRMFLPSPPEEFQDGGIITAGYKSNMEDYAEALRHMTLVNLNQYQMVVYSALLVEGNKVTSTLVRDTLGSIRGRQKVS